MTRVSIDCENITYDTLGNEYNQLKSIHTQLHYIYRCKEKLLFLTQCPVPYAILCSKQLVFHPLWLTHLHHVGSHASRLSVDEMVA